RDRRSPGQPREGRRGALGSRRGAPGMTNVGTPAIPGGPLAAADVATAAQLACLLEASAPKPGNVSPGRHFSDARYEDFLASAVAIGEPLAGAGGTPARAQGCSAD